MNTDYDWHAEMSIRQSEVVKTFEKNGWVITGINEKQEVTLANDNVEDKRVNRKARVSRTPY